MGNKCCSQSDTIGSFPTDQTKPTKTNNSTKLTLPEIFKQKKIRFSNGMNNDPIAIVMHISVMQLQKKDVTTNMKAEAKAKMTNAQIALEAGRANNQQLQNKQIDCTKVIQPGQTVELTIGDCQYYSVIIFKPNGEQQFPDKNAKIVDSPDGRVFFKNQGRNISQPLLKDRSFCFMDTSRSANQNFYLQKYPPGHCPDCPKEQGKQFVECKTHRIGR